MSQLGNTNEIKTIITGDASGIVAASAEGEAAVDGFKQTAESASGSGDKIDRGFTRAYESISRGFRKNVRDVTAFVGSLGAAVGVAGAFYEIGGKIEELFSNLFTTPTEKAQKFSESLDLTKEKESLAAYEAQLAKLSGSLATAGTNRDIVALFSPNLANDSNARTAAQQDLEDQITAINVKAEALRRQISAQERSKSAKERETDLAGQKRAQIAFEVDVAEAVARVDESENERRQQQADLKKEIIELGASEEVKIELEKQEKIQQIEDTFFDPNTKGEAEFRVRQYYDEQIRKLKADQAAQDADAHNATMAQIQQQGDAQLDYLVRIQEAMRQVRQEADQINFGQIGNLGVAQDTGLINLLIRGGR